MREAWIQEALSCYSLTYSLKLDLGGQGYLVLGSSFSGVHRAELTPYGARLNFHAR